MTAFDDEDTTYFNCWMVYLQVEHLYEQRHSPPPPLPPLPPLSLLIFDRYSVLVDPVDPIMLTYY